jgi:DNA mismatch repair protein MutS2
LGLPGPVVEQARNLLGKDSRQTEAFLSRLRRLTAEMEAGRDELEQSREALAREREAQRNQAGEELERLRRRSAKTLEDTLKRFRAEARVEIEAIRDRKRRDREMRHEAKAVGRLRRLVPEGLEANLPETGRPLERSDLKPGIDVLVRSLGRSGQVVQVRGEQVEVRLGRVGFTVQVSDLSRPDSEEAVAPVKTVRTFIQQEAARRRVPPATETVSTPTGSELMLLGKTVDEALEAVDRFLDRSTMAGLSQVRIIHGHGTGRLKAAVRKFLEHHALVASHRPGGAAEGGDGATVARLGSD